MSDVIEVVERTTEFVEVIERGPMGPLATVGGIEEVPGLQAALDLKQNANTAATDAELATLATAQAALEAAILTKQNAATAATDAELAALDAAIQDALDDLQAAVDLLPTDSDLATEIQTAIMLHAAGDASDAELLAETNSRISAVAAEASARAAADVAEAAARSAADQALADDLADEAVARDAADDVLTAAAAAAQTDADAAQAAADAAQADADAAQATASAALPKAGGTMTGPIVLPGNPAGALQAAPKQYVDTAIADLINGAPGALDTLKELADALAASDSADDAALAALVASVATKLTAASNLSDLANAATARSNLGLGTAATQAAAAFDAAGAAAAAQAAAIAASQPLHANLTEISAVDPSTIGKTVLAAADAAAIRAALGIPIAGEVGGPPLVIRKTADQTKNNSAALSNDNELALPVAASGIWLIDLSLLTQAADATADWKLAWTVPAGATLRWGPLGASTANVPWTAVGAATSQNAVLTESDQSILGSQNVSGVIPIRGILVVGATPGTAQFRWAQSAATASDSKILTNSVLIATRLA